MNLRFLGCISIIVLFLGLGYVVWRWPRGKQYTFSQHVARRKTSSIFYSMLFILCLPPIGVSFTRLLVPGFYVSAWTIEAFWGAIIAQLLCTFVPETGVTRARIHRLLAGISAASLLIAMAGIVATPDRLLAFIGGASLTLMIAVGVLAATAAGRRTALILQVVYFGAFFVPLIYMFVRI